MNILITGATGFVGNKLVKALVNEGHDCRCLVRDRKKAEDIFKNHKDIEFLIGDITKPETLTGITDNIDYVFHMAAMLGDGGTPEQIMQNNFSGTKNILNKMKAGQFFIFASTPGVQGFGHKNATENYPYSPRGAYEKSKVAAEEFILQTCTQNKINWTILRPDFVYGPGDLRRIPLYKKIAAKKMYILGSGNSVLSPTYIDDVIQGFLKCVANDKAINNIFNISGETLTASRYLGTIAKVLNTNLPKTRIPLFVCYAAAVIAEPIFQNILKKAPPVTKSRIAFLTQNHGTDSQKASDLLDFKPVFSFEEGMRETINWCKKEGLL